MTLSIIPAGSNGQQPTPSCPEKTSPPDLSLIHLDITVPFTQRHDWIANYLGDPSCFRIGEIGVQVEFSNSTFSLQDCLTALLLRKKSGL